MGRRSCRRACLAHTIENRADKVSGEIGLLQEMQMIWDLWSIRMVGPRPFTRVGHGSDVYKGRSISVEEGSEVKRRCWGVTGEK